MPNKREIEQADALYDRLMDSTPSTRSLTRSTTVNMEPDMHMAMQDLVGHPDLPFESMSDFTRNALNVYIESMRDFLDPVKKTLWRILRDEYARETAQRYVLSIENLLDMAVDNLRRLTMARSWTGAVKSLKSSAGALEDFPECEWKTLAAQGWLEHPGVQALKRTWAESMAQEDPTSWNAVVEVFKRFEELADG